MRRVALRPSASAQSAAAMNHVAKFCTLPAATYLVARDKGQGSRHFPSSCRRCWSAERMLQLSGCALPALRCSRRHSAANAIMLSTSGATGWIAAPFCHGAEKPPSDCD
jgi:hypothetical protein